jgi:mono/diheme cytochrome c family protein
MKARIPGTFLLAILCAVLITMIAGAQTDDWKVPERAARKKNPLTADAQTIAEGKDLYVQNCAACHGKRGRGDGIAAANLNRRPGDLTSAEVARQTDGALFWKIGEGHSPMPGFSQLVSEAGRWHLVCYLRTLAPHSATRPTSQAVAPETATAPYKNESRNRKFPAFPLQHPPYD